MSFDRTADGTADCKPQLLWPCSLHSAVLKLTSAKDNFARLMSEGASKLLVQLMSSPLHDVRRMVLSALVYLSCYAVPRVSYHSAVLRAICDSLKCVLCRYGRLAESYGA